MAARHGVFGPIDARVENLSPAGAALLIEGAGHRADLVPAGESLEQVRIHCRDATLFEGEARVRHSAGRGTHLLLGIELGPGAIDFSALYRIGARRSFAERLAVAMEGEDEVPGEFKVWVAGQRAALEKLKAFLDTEERAVAGLDLSTRRQALDAYLAEVGPRMIERMNAASRELRLLVADVPGDRHPACRELYRRELHHLILHSPFMRRAHAKPLGYAGDYEMMNMLYRDHAEGDSLFAKAMNLYAVQEGAARANINRLGYLGARIREAMDGRAARGRARVASIGCGPAREIGLLLEQEPGLGRRLDVALIDQEERVIAYCERTLSPLASATGARFAFIQESVRGLLGAREMEHALGERDLVYSAGLFDYLQPRTFAALLGRLYGALPPGGQLCVGNVGSHNPTRHTMEYLLDWFLIHRSPDELGEFARALVPRPSRIEVDAEPTGVNLFLRIWR